MELFDAGKFRDKKELFAYLIENKSQLIARKKAVIKEADGIPFITSLGTYKANKAEVNEKGYIDASLVINTTNILDSHKDLHLPKLWNKSLKDISYRVLNKEHKRGFEDIIADGNDLEAYVKTFNWVELGFPQFKGNTEALMYDVKIYPDIHPFMYKKYNTGKVRNHSVEMYYVKIEMAVNNPEYKEEFAVYEKYFPMMANQEAETDGYFFAVKEAKEIGGAAVVRGSNFATPVYDIKEEQSEDTRNIEQLNGTQINYDFLVKNF